MAEKIIPWIENYRQQLGMIKPIEIGMPDSSLVFPGTAEKLDAWRAENKPVQLNIVAVSPNEGELPLRMLSYVTGALETIRTMRHMGLKVDALRIINPVYLNPEVNNGDTEFQQAYGISFRENVRKWVETYYPDLDEIQINLDQGKPITDEARQKADQFGTKLSAQTLYDLAEKGNRHSDSSQDVDDETVLRQSVLYGSAHAGAWQYEHDTTLFENGRGQHGVVNYMPNSELAFLTVMKEAGINLSPAANDVITLVSRDMIHTPYFRIIEDEPQLDWDISLPALQLIVRRISNSQHNGSHEGHEIRTNLNNIVTMLQRHNAAKKK